MTLPYFLRARSLSGKDTPLPREDVAMLPLLLFTLLGFASQASAATWYFLRYYTPSGAKFTSFSGDMVIPPLPQAGTYYLWPGLQPTDNSGVYQNVLDGRSGTWWIGSGWYAFRFSFSLHETKPFDAKHSSCSGLFPTVFHTNSCHRCCSNPSLPWGSGFNTYSGETVTFSNTCMLLVIAS